jgi:hypothetical protein
MGKSDTKKRVDAQGSAIDVASMGTYLAIVSGLNEQLNAKKPKKEQLDESKLYELATVIFEMSKDTVENWSEIGKICDENSPQKITISCSIQLDRSVAPSNISTSGKFVESHSFGRKVQCPDPNQPDLPIDTEQDPSETIE